MGQTLQFLISLHRDRGSTGRLEVEFRVQCAKFDSFGSTPLARPGDESHLTVPLQVVPQHSGVKAGAFIHSTIIAFIVIWSGPFYEGRPLFASFAGFARGSELKSRIVLRQARKGMAGGQRQSMSAGRREGMRW